jgi:hypothetical protein
MAQRTYSVFAYFKMPKKFYSGDALATYNTWSRETCVFAQYGLTSSEADKLCLKINTQYHFLKVELSPEVEFGGN